MTVSTTLAAQNFVGGGGVKTFPCSFKVFDEDHVQVFADGVEQMLTTDYAVTGVGDESFNVVFNTAPASGVNISVARVVPLLQETDYLDNDDFPAETHERALDLLVMMVQQLSTGSMGKAVHFPPSDPGTLTGLLPAFNLRASKLLGFDANGEVVAVTGAALGAFSTGDAHDWSALQTFLADIRLEGSNADPGTEEPNIELFRDNSTVEAEIGAVRWKAPNSAGTEVHYAKEFATIKANTANATRGERVFQVANGTDGLQTTWLRGRAEGPAIDGKRLQFDADRDTYFEAVTDDQLDLYLAGVLQMRASPQGGFRFGNPTGGAPASAGHLNTQAMFINNNPVRALRLSDPQTTTSGTAFDFTGIVAAARRVTVMFNAVGLSGNDDYLVQIGPAAGIETSGYVSSSATIPNAANPGVTSSVAGFIFRSGNAAGVVSGQMVLTRLTGNTWVASHAGKILTTVTVAGGGSKTLADEMAQLRVTRSGTNTFDAGSLAILVE